MKFIDERVENYCLDKSSQPSEECIELGDYTKENHPLGRMISGELVASVLGFLIRSKGAKSILEVGTFTGYSALAMAENLPDSGSVTTIDKNKKLREFATERWAQSPHGKKIKDLYGDANEVLQSLSNEKFDFIFIDADKGSYKNYLDLCLPLLNSKGVIVVDNVLWSGRVVDGFNDEEDKSTIFLKEFNEYVKSLDDLYTTMLPVRDGLFLIQKKEY